MHTEQKMRSTHFSNPRNDIGGNVLNDTELDIEEPSPISNFERDSKNQSVMKQLNATGFPASMNTTQGFPFNDTLYGTRTSFNKDPFVTQQNFASNTLNAINQRKGRQLGPDAITEKTEKTNSRQPYFLMTKASEEARRLEKKISKMHMNLPTRKY